MNSNQHIVDFSLDTKWDDLPESVQHQSKRALLDNLGVLIAGGTTPASRITNAFVEDQMAGNNPKAACTVLSTGKKVSAVGAALANGIAANGLDMDDGYNAAKGHPGAALLPVLLASAELATEVSGQDVLTAIRVHSFQEATRLSRAVPRDTEEAQYNLAYGLACAVLKGTVGPQEVTPPAIYDPQILAFMDKIEQTNPLQ